MNVDTHARILREALASQVSQEALGWIIRANQCCDLYQFSPQRHFDNAPDRETMGRWWKKGLYAYYQRGLRLAVSQPLRRKGALKAFGEASHALADFYAHTNWVEIHLAAGTVEELAPLYGPQFEMDRFPAEIQSGYFSLRFGFKGCPQKNGCYQPPLPFRFCHASMAKDHADRGHGAEQADPMGVSYYDLAVRLAVQATRQLWEQFCRQVEEQSEDLEAAWHVAFGHRRR